MMSDTRADTGDAMPDIALEGPDGATVKPSDFAGRKLAVFFYPKDDTPGCTTENIAFSELKPRFDAAGVALLGVSKDPPPSTASSPKSTALRAARVRCGNGRTGRCARHLGREEHVRQNLHGHGRTTYLVGKDGRIARVWRKVKVKGHAEEVLEAAEASG